jgi:small basic protein (TIGR04137 family)
MKLAGRPSEAAMSIDKSLKKKGSLVRARNVLKRHERITKLQEMDRWVDDQSPIGLPKVRVYRIVAKKGTKKKKEE